MKKLSFRGSNKGVLAHGRFILWLCYSLWFGGPLFSFAWLWPVFWKFLPTVGLQTWQISEQLDCSAFLSGWLYPNQEILPDTDRHTPHCFRGEAPRLSSFRFGLFWWQELHSVRSQPIFGGLCTPHRYRHQKCPLSFSVHTASTRQTDPFPFRTWKQGIRRSIKCRFYRFQKGSRAAPEIFFLRFTLLFWAKRSRILSLSHFLRFGTPRGRRNLGRGATSPFLRTAQGRRRSLGRRPGAACCRWRGHTWAPGFWRGEFLFRTECFLLGSCCWQCWSGGEEANLCFFGAGNRYLFRGFFWLRGWCFFASFEGNTCFWGFPLL